jgi:hypothetical protein
MLQGGADWGPGPTYVAISKLPWVYALAAWGTSGTWTRGIHFVEGDAEHPLGPPDEGTVDSSRLRFGLAVTHPASFAVERRRGWHETPDSPPRGADDLWDEQRVDRVTMRKPQPGEVGATPLELRAQGRYAAFRHGPSGTEHGDALYALTQGNEVWPLTDVQWADWDPTGRLLVATKLGQLQIRAIDGRAESILDEVDLSDFTPDPKPAPSEARRW